MLAILLAPPGLRAAAAAAASARSTGVAYSTGRCHVDSCVAVLNQYGAPEVGSLYCIQIALAPSTDTWPGGDHCDSPVALLNQYDWPCGSSIRCQLAPPPLCVLASECCGLFRSCGGLGDRVMLSRRFASLRSRSDCFRISRSATGAVASVGTGIEGRRIAGAAGGGSHSSAEL